jgi:hypothetical protein
MTLNIEKAIFLFFYFFPTLTSLAIHTLPQSRKGPLIIARTRFAAEKNMGGLAEKPAVSGTEMI